MTYKSEKNWKTPFNTSLDQLLETIETYPDGKGSLHVWWKRENIFRCLPNPSLRVGKQFFLDDPPLALLLWVLSKLPLPPEITDRIYCWCVLFHEKINK